MIKASSRPARTVPMGTLNLNIPNFNILNFSMLGLFGLSLLAAAVPARASDDHGSAVIKTLGEALGDEDPSTVLTLRIWLNLHDRAGLDARVQALYTAGSPTYQKWLSNEDLQAYTPTANEIAAVRAEVESHGLMVKDMDPLGLSLRVEGTAANFEAALQTRVSRYQVAGILVRITSTAAELGGAAAGLVANVGGLNSIPPRPLLMRPLNPLTGKLFARVPATSSRDLEASSYQAQCFYPPMSVTEKGVDAYDGSTPVTAWFKGPIYQANDNQTSGCAYTAAQVQGFYHMDEAYKRDYDGRGQTIVIVEAGTQDYAETDASVFNSTRGYPPSHPKITSSTILIKQPALQASVTRLFRPIQRWSGRMRSHREPTSLWWKFLRGTTRTYSLGSFTPWRNILVT